MALKPIAKEIVDEPIEAEEKKYTLRLGPQAAKDVEWLARRYEMSIADVFRRAIATERWLLEQFDDEQRVILEHKRTGRQKEIAFR